MAKMGQSDQISLGPAVTAREQDVRLGCLTGGHDPGQLLHQNPGSAYLWVSNHAKKRC